MNFLLKGTILNRLFEYQKFLMRKGISFRWGSFYSYLFWEFQYRNKRTLFFGELQEVFSLNYEHSQLSYFQITSYIIIVFSYQRTQGKNV